MTRFRVGDQVSIKKEPIYTGYAGQQGIVIAIDASRRTKPGNRTLDKYMVRFPDGEHQFFDVQLDPYPSAGMIHEP